MNRDWYKRLRDSLLPVPSEVAQGMDPATIEAFRRNAVLQAGLGMLAAKERGQGLGMGSLAGLNIGQDALQQGLGQAYVGMRARREDERLDLAEKRQADWQRQAEEERAWQRKKFEEQQALEAADRAYRRQQDELMARERALDNARQNAQLGISQGQLGLARRSARVGAAQERADAKASQAAQLISEAIPKIERAIAEEPNDPRIPALKQQAEELKSRYFGLTGRPWAPQGLAQLGGDPLDEFIRKQLGENPAGPGQNAGGAVRITSDQEYENLPRGVQFIGPDGRLRRKP